MEKITYGAPRLVDWVAQIKAGSATVRVHFTSGALTSYGVTPAEYTTTNAFIQKVIENSSYYKEGRITTLRRTKIAETDKPKPKSKPKAPATTQAVTAPQPVVETPVVDKPAPVVETSELIEASAREDAAPEVQNEVEEVTATDITKVEVTCLPDAQAYLQENYNIPSYKIRNCETAQRAAAEHGIQFVGAKFDTLNVSDNTESVIEEGE